MLNHNPLLLLACKNDKHIKILYIFCKTFFLIYPPTLPYKSGKEALRLASHYMLCLCIHLLWLLGPVPYLNCALFGFTGTCWSKMMLITTGRLCILPRELFCFCLETIFLWFLTNFFLPEWLVLSVNDRTLCLCDWVLLQKFFALCRSRYRFCLSRNSYCLDD